MRAEMAAQDPELIVKILDGLPAWASGIGVGALGIWAFFAKLRKSVSSDETATQAHTAWAQLIVDLRAEVKRLSDRVAELEAERDEYRDLLADYRANRTAPGPLQ